MKNALKEFLDLLNVKLLKERKLLIWTTMSLLNAPKHHLNPRIEFGKRFVKIVTVTFENVC